MTFNDILSALKLPVLDVYQAHVPMSILSDASQEILAQGVFVAYQGEKVHGKQFIPQAVAKGAMIIVSDINSRELDNHYVIPDSVLLFTVKSPKEFLYQALPIFLRNPSSGINITAITGTNGKTTFTYLMEAILKQAGTPVAVLGTVNYRIAQTVIPAKNTTPGFCTLQYLFHQMRNAHVQDCVMEASSHALAQERLRNIHVNIAVFSNLTQDHLDYHLDMEQYFLAKAKLFTPLSKSDKAVINVDDVYGRRLITMTSAQILTYGIDYPAMVRAEQIYLEAKLTRLTIQYPGGKVRLTTRLMGRHNVYNLLAAFTAGLARGLDPVIITQAMEHIRAIPGRLELVDTPTDYAVYIDYAHTPDGLVNVLNALRAVVKGRIITVFGCGGDRDRTKRPLMGQVVSRLSDWAIVTSDNPRSEDPSAIIHDILLGMENKNFAVVVDRREAIQQALKMANANDMVLLAGKGHEDYQIFKDKTVSFDERVIVKEILCSLLKNS